MKSITQTLYLWGKVFNVRLLLLQGCLRDEHGEVAVLHTQLLDLTVKEFFNRLPDGEGPGPQHVAAADVVIFNHFCFSDDLQSDRKRQSLKTDQQSLRIRMDQSHSNGETCIFLLHLPESTSLPGSPLSWPPIPNCQKKSSN